MACDIYARGVNSLRDALVVSSSGNMEESHTAIEGATCQPSTVLGV